MAKESKMLRYLSILIPIILLSAYVDADVCWANSNCRQQGKSRYCDRLHAVFLPGTCKDQVADGKGCSILSTNDQCISGRCLCGICGLKLDNQGKCSTNWQCKSNWCGGTSTGLCGGKCASKIQNGASCYDNNQCTSGKCYCGKCGTTYNGGSCSENTDCVSGWCSGGFTTIGCRGTCSSKSARGASCSDRNQCTSGKCFCGKCGKLVKGESCSNDSDCLSNSCSGWITVGCNGTCK